MQKGHPLPGPKGREGVPLDGTKGKWKEITYDLPFSGESEERIARKRASHKCKG